MSSLVKPYISTDLLNAITFFNVATSRGRSFIILGLLHILIYIDGCRSVDRIDCSLVTPVNRQRQSDGYQ